MADRRRKKSRTKIKHYHGLPFEEYASDGKRKKSFYRLKDPIAPSCSTAAYTADELQPNVSSESESVHHSSVLADNFDGIDSDENLDDGGGVNMWSRRKERLRIGWEEKSEELLFSYATTLAIDEQAQCCLCEGESPRYRCRDCGIANFFCKSCLLKQHSAGSFFHRIEHYEEEDSMFVPCKFVGKISHHSCKGFCSKSPRLLTCVDGLGFQHRAVFEFCSCQSDASLIVQNGFWPGTPLNPTICFSFEFMDLMSSMVLECQVSLRKFCDAIKCRYSPLTPIYVNDFYPVLQRGCYLEFRYFRYTCDYGGSYTDLDRGTSCPGCPKDAGIRTFIADGCFGLVRKKSAGSAEDPSRFKDNLFLLEQKKVDCFVENYERTKKKSEREGCHTFRAGEETATLLSKGKQQKLDETGLFGTVCRHDHPQAFYSCKFGERIGYMVYGLEQLLRPLNSTSLQAFLMYDISCILEKHLKRNNRQDLLSKVTLAIPGFHVYGHNMQCQLRFSPRRCAGLGLTDGEGAERLWSYLREFSYMTKEMTSANREDVLNDALLHFSERKKQRLGSLLVAKLQKAKTLKDSTEKELEEFLALCPGLDANGVSILADAEKRRLEEPTVDQVESWDESYVQSLLEYKSVRMSLENLNSSDIDAGEEKKLLAKEKKINKQLKKIESKFTVKERWTSSDPTYKSAFQRLKSKEIASLLIDIHGFAYDREIWKEQMKRRSSAGQSVAVKISKNIAKVTKKIKAAHQILVYKFGQSGKDCDCPSLDKVFDISSDVYRDLTLPLTSTTAERKAIDLHMLASRCKEEEVLVRQEMQAHFEFLRIQIQKVKCLLVEEQHERCFPPPLLRQIITAHTKQLLLCVEFYSSYIELPDLPATVLPKSKTVSLFDSVDSLPEPVSASAQRYDSDVPVCSASESGSETDD